MTGIVQELVYTVDHKKLGLMYIGSGLVFFVVAGVMATLMRMQLFFPSSKFLEAGRFQPLFYDARHGDDLSRGHAVGVWVCQLSRAPNDRDA